MHDETLMRTISSNCEQLLPFLSAFSNNLFYYQLLSIFPPYVRSLSFRRLFIIYPAVNQMDMY